MTTSGIGVHRGQLDQQHLDLPIARLAEQALHPVEALRLRRIAQPEHRRAAEVEPKLHAAVAGTIDRIRARASIVQQHGEVPAFQLHDGRIDQLGQRRTLHGETSIRRDEGAVARIAEHHDVDPRGSAC